MSRVTPPVQRAIRTISSSAQVARPSSLLDSRLRTAQCLPQRLSELKAECARRQLNPSGSKAELLDRLTAHDLARSHSTSSSDGHRPTVPSYHIRPLMQGFHTSPPAAAKSDPSTIDFFFFPTLSPEPPANPFSKLRVPLLPDNYSPDRSPGSPHALETPVMPLLRSEISVVAAHPEDVVAAALTEVVGNEAEEPSLSDLTKVFGGEEETQGSGALKTLWNDVMDDILGKAKPSHA